MHKFAEFICGLAHTEVFCPNLVRHVLRGEVEARGGETRRCGVP
eukprot:COSAG02_NODE_34_length_49821_cov_105.420438_4_plen_44_part_00